MKVMNEFGKFAPNAVFISMFLGAIAGICYVGLIPLILISLENNAELQYQSENLNLYFGVEVVNDKIALTFFILCFIILAMRTISQLILSRVSVRLTTEIRKRLYYRIVNCSVDSLEKTGPSKIINAMTMDVNRIVAGARVAPPVLISLVTVVGMLFYIWMVNSEVFYFVIICLIIGVVTYQIPMIFGGRYYDRARKSMDELQESFRAIVLGAKELKLNRKKRDSFIENDLLSVESKIKSDNLKANTIVTAAMNYGDMLGFFVIGCLAFIFVNYHQVSSDELVAIIMIVLYISGPVSQVLFSIPLLIEANISYRKMNLLFYELPDEGYSQDDGNVPDWREVTFKNVCYTYQNSDGFQVGPIDLKVKKGEITFIVGGNGSGKSTFSKIVTQHFFPKVGEIYFDNVKIDEGNINRYRQCIASIYSDYYLFDSIHGADIGRKELNRKVNELLVDLELADKVSYVGGRFSTIKLSDGQRRRLALLVAFIEDKELYLFDEWAADQDSVFREVYYHKILPELKARGKAVVAISHDDRYFHIADQLVKFEAGLRV